MDIKKVGEIILSSVRSAKSFSSLLPSSSNRPEVPARALAAAAVARALAGLPPHQRLALSSKSGGLASLYNCEDHNETVELLEDDYYNKDFDPVRHILETIDFQENHTSVLEKKVSERLLQLDFVTEKLSQQVMEHYEEMMEGMRLVMELQHDLQVANVICKNGRRNLTSSMHEVSQDLVITENARKKQFYLDLLPILSQLKHALHMRSLLDSLVESGQYGKAFRKLAEILQLLDQFSELSAIKEMNHNLEAWVSRALEKLDSILQQVCKNFNPQNYATVLDAYALIDDIPGLVEKLQGDFTQLVISETQSILREYAFQGMDPQSVMKKSRMTYNDLCVQLPETKFRHCLLRILEVLFDLMSSYYTLMSWKPFEMSTHRISSSGRNWQCGMVNKHRRSGSVGHLQSALNSHHSRGSLIPRSGRQLARSLSCTDTPLSKKLENGYQPSLMKATMEDKCVPIIESSGKETETQLQKAQESGYLITIDNNDDEPEQNDLWNQFRVEAAYIIGQALDKGRRNFWQIVSSRIATLFSTDVVCSTSMQQFLQCYEHLNAFILIGETFCGVEATQFRQKMKGVCENYFWQFHRQNIEALRIVLEKETWQRISPDAIRTVNLEGLVGNGAALLVSYKFGPYKDPATNILSVDVERCESHGFKYWLEKGNPFRSKKSSMPKEGNVHVSDMQDDKDGCNGNGITDVGDEDEESEDLFADFIDEDSQLPSRISNSMQNKCASSRNLEYEEIEGLTGSALSLLRSMDKYARLMQKLETLSFEIFKGICQLFEAYFYFIFKNFVQDDGPSNNRGSMEYLNPRLRSTVVRISQSLLEQRQKMHGGPVSPHSHNYFNGSFFSMDATTLGPIHPSVPTQGKNYGLKERCTSAQSLVRISEILQRSRAHLQSLLPQTALLAFEDFFTHTVDCVSDLKEQLLRTTARRLLNISSYAEKIANVKWEVKEIGMDHNGYVDLLLGEFNHFKTKISHGEICKEDQDVLLEYGVDDIVEILVEGYSRVKRCTNEGRALMSLDLQILFTGLQHLASTKVKSKMQVVEAYIKAYYLPETEYIHWARAHPEYTKNQVIGLINLVASMNNWKRKSRLELVEKIEAGDF